MKKILFLIHDLGNGGAEKVMISLVNHLDRNKYDTTVIALFGGGVNERFLAPHIHFHTVFPRSIPGNSKWMKLLSPRRLHHLIVRDRYDIEIAYLHGPCARIISGSDDPNAKLISWMHGNQRSKEQTARSFRSFEESKRCYERFDQIVCVSETVKEGFLSVYPNLKNVSVCYNTIESDRILALKDEPIEDAIFASDEIKLVAVGKIIKAKGFDRLARIVKQLRDEGIPVHLYALGTGKDRENIEAYLQQNRLEQAYTFLGYQQNPYKYIAKCDLFVCASLTEGFSTATIEALIVGVPVCTVDVAGMREILGDNEYGVITENNEDALTDGIRYILNSRNLAHYKEKAQERGKLFNAKITVQKTEALFDRLLLNPVSATGK